MTDLTNVPEGLNHHQPLNLITGQDIPEGYRLKWLTEQCVAIGAAPDYATNVLCFLYYSTAEYCATHLHDVINFNKLGYVRISGQPYFTDSVPVLLNLVTGERV